jgi:hypothetical protein
MCVLDCFGLPDEYITDGRVGVDVFERSGSKRRCGWVTSQVKHMQR